ncbi:hypothetical protein LshimejAT787_0704240 [Lyophyllum shimeji]|uniref:Uncharacterized protein n=1 Tax=Lyophyllum shimeji TaxID=47721 RepID=A0A9P3PQX3_LYOSH|nr:hypothetical protein LshimejAT787_0704240 [Lyophyllum shimeji]
MRFQAKRVSQNNSKAFYPEAVAKRQPPTPDSAQRFNVSRLADQASSTSTSALTIATPHGSITVSPPTIPGYSKRASTPALPLLLQSPIGGPVQYGA